MAKSKPIGVRFDLYKLETIQKENNLKSHQSVVNFLMDRYLKNEANTILMTPFGDMIRSDGRNMRQKKVKLDVSTDFAVQDTFYHKEPVELTLNAKPEPPKNLTGIDLSIWKSENWK